MISRTKCHSMRRSHSNERETIKKEMESKERESKERESEER